MGKHTASCVPGFSWGRFFDSAVPSYSWVPGRVAGRSPHWSVQSFLLHAHRPFLGELTLSRVKLASPRRAYSSGVKPAFFRRAYSSGVEPAFFRWCLLDEIANSPSFILLGAGPRCPSATTSACAIVGVAPTPVVFRASLETPWRCC